MGTGRIRRAAATTLLSCGLAIGGLATTAAAAPAHDGGDGHDRDHGTQWAWSASGWVWSNQDNGRSWDNHDGGQDWGGHDHGGDGRHDDGRHDDRRHDDGRRDDGRHDDGRVFGTVTSRIELNVRDNPSLNADVGVALSPGSTDRIACKTHGSNVNGTSTWYWLTGAQGWATAAFFQANGDVPNC
ncbi:hypothetical protein [Streptomyces sp. CBMA152]|uniref:hypothetical protein n=1 Tax=Streptomyces sp. CBMA152 TaxID=1896312 RepID=UPI001661473D|nr:hypothetical protein [Streptomyces sp. CBMA152]MBD0745077.1 hypothetical protein [Streptomyces sp. CBMA152]